MSEPVLELERVRALADEMVKTLEAYARKRVAAERYALLIAVGLAAALVDELARTARCSPPSEAAAITTDEGQRAEIGVVT